MRLSEAIATGRVLLRPKAGTFLNMREGSGCVLGMAFKAASVLPTHSSEYTMNDVFDTWPWTGIRTGESPCGCELSDHNQGQIIPHLFDNHVMQAIGIPGTFPAWTLDQLIDWVRSVEPAEPAPAAAEQQVAETVAVAHE